MTPSYRGPALKGKVERISADTIVDDKEKTARTLRDEALREH